MAKFLDTQAISSELMKLIKEAKEKIILVTYNLSVNTQIQERLKAQGKKGTLAEMVIIYGKLDLKQSEINWIKEIQDLKVIEKQYLHSKCYLNEDRAIICSMNLSDFSQVKNMEMGILISRQEDPKVYEEIMDEINNAKINGIRKSFDKLESSTQVLTKISSNNEYIKPKEKIDTSAIKTEPTLEQKLIIELLKRWRYFKSKKEKSAESNILTDDEIKRLSLIKKIDKYSIYDIIPRKIANKFGEEIIEEIITSDKYTFGTVINTWYQSDESKYDRVKLKLIKTGEERWFDTTQELPYKDRLVAAELNKVWFNDYLYLDN